MGFGDAGTGAYSTQNEYRAPFGPQQWIATTINNNVFNPNIVNWFAGVQHRAFVPNVGGTCSGSACYDPAAVYPGIETLANGSQCSGSGKSEYQCTPFVNVTTVDPVNSPNDQVNTLIGSTTTLMNGDQMESRYNNGFIDVFCKQSTTALPTWSSGMTITAGTTYIEAAGEVFVGYATGTAGSTQPTWPTTTATWAQGANGGTKVTDGGGQWQYWGDTCPSDLHYTQIIHAPYTYLANNASTAGTDPSGNSPLTSPLGPSFPFLWAQGGISAAVPFFSNVTMGTVGTSGSTEPCSAANVTAGNCVLMGGNPQIVIEDE
jgi:hypothetical protein